MFKRDHHVRIATILQALEPKILQSHNCYFAGGTAIVLSRDEYRESMDIDFMVSDIEGYGELRNSIRDNNNLSSILRPGTELKLSRDIRADKDAIRTMIDQGGTEIKFEIVLEGRIRFEPPNNSQTICGVQTITDLDMATSKLLANSDRWSDDSVFSRDIIDLAMLELTPQQLKAAKEKAEVPYGKSIEKDLKNAVEALRSRKGRLSQCMETLKMDDPPAAVLWEKIRNLN